VLGNGGGSITLRGLRAATPAVPSDAQSGRGGILPGRQERAGIFSDQNDVARCDPSRISAPLFEMRNNGVGQIRPEQEVSQIGKEVGMNEDGGAARPIALNHLQF